MFVLTVDQRGSRRVGDHVDVLLGDLRRLDLPDVVRGFDRTVGDEVQAVVRTPAAALDLALGLLRRGGWTVGIGAGDVDLPMPTDVRAASGPAFVHARAAVERAKSRTRPVPLAVEASDAVAAQDAEAVLTLVAALRARRTEAGWAVVDAVVAGATQEAVAERLGVTQQAVSQRLRAAHWAEELGARPAAERLLARAARTGEDGRHAPGATARVDGEGTA